MTVLGISECEKSIPSNSLEWWPSPKVRSKTAFVLSPKDDKISLEKEADVDCRRFNGCRYGVRLNNGATVWPGIFSPTHRLAYIIWKLFKLRNIKFSTNEKVLAREFIFANILHKNRTTHRYKVKMRRNSTVNTYYLKFFTTFFLFSSWPESSSFWHCEPGLWTGQLATPCAFSPVSLPPRFWCTASPAQKNKKFISD